LTAKRPVEITAPVQVRPTRAFLAGSTKPTLARLADNVRIMSDPLRRLVSREACHQTGGHEGGGSVTTGQDGQGVERQVARCGFA